LPGTGRVYLRPLAPGRDLDPESSLPLAGGPLRFAACQVLTRNGALRCRNVAARDLEGPSFAPLVARMTAARGGAAPVVMGVVNVTPDSFSDGGRFAGARDAIAHGRALAAAGAGIIDVGGESTRPGAAPVPVGEEQRRILPVVEALAADGIAVSIDTRNAATMAAAAGAGARMINDVSALAHDARAAGIVAATGSEVVLVHSRGDPRTMQGLAHYRHAALDVYDELERRVDAALAAGIARARIIVDPGIGFAKFDAHNALILRWLALYHGLGCPLLLGASRKSFIGRIAGVGQADARVAGSLAAALWGVSQGVHMLRVHDVAETAQALRIWNWLDAGGSDTCGA